MLKRKKKITIHIGEYYASGRPVRIYTLLGSCVAVCLFDPKNRIGGMNHILVPGRADLKNFDDSARYGINALELLINEIMQLGGERHQIIAKVFGGAHIIQSISKENGMGQKIIYFVKDFLNNERIRIISHDLGGNDIRKVYFYTDTGNVYLKRTDLKLYPNIAEEEKRCSNRIKDKVKQPGSIDLF